MEELSEKRIEKYLKESVEKKGGLCIKLHPFTLTGIPDRMMLIPTGVCIFAEVKSAKGRVSKAQAIVHARFRDLGFPVQIIDSTLAVDNLIKRYAW